MLVYEYATRIMRVSFCIRVVCRVACRVAYRVACRVAGVFILQILCACVCKVCDLRMMPNDSQLVLGRAY